MWEASLRRSSFCYSSFLSKTPWPCPCVFHAAIPGVFLAYIGIWYLWEVQAFRLKTWRRYFSLVVQFLRKAASVIRFFLGAFECLTKLSRCRRPARTPEEEEGGEEVVVIKQTEKEKTTEEEEGSFIEDGGGFLDPKSGTCATCIANSECPMKLWREVRMASKWARPLVGLSVFVAIVATALNVMLVALPGNTAPNDDSDDSVFNSLIRFAPPWSFIAYIDIQAVIALLIAGLLQRQLAGIPRGRVSTFSAKPFLLHLTAWIAGYTLAIALISLSLAGLTWPELPGQYGAAAAAGAAVWSVSAVIIWLATAATLIGLSMALVSLLRRRRRSDSLDDMTRATALSTPPQTADSTPPPTSITPASGLGSWILGEPEVHEGCGCSCCAPDGKFRLSRESPEARAGWWTFLTFSWMSPLIALGHARSLETRDLYTLPNDVNSRDLEQRLKNVWMKEVTERKEKASLVRAILKFGQTSLLSAAGLKFIYDSLSLMGPMILNLLIRFLGKCHWALYDPEKAEERAFAGTLLIEGIGIIALFTASNFAQTVLLHQYFRLQFRLGIETRSALINAIYSKSLRVSFAADTKKEDKPESSADTTAKKEKSRWCRKKKTTSDDGVTKDATTTGEIVNLMSVDGERVLECMPWLHILWSAPYQICVSLVLLWLQLGPSMLAGFGVMCIGIPVTAKIAAATKRQQLRLMGVRDERIKITNEVFSGIKILKVYAWEQSFKTKISDIRERELAQLWKNQLLAMVQRIFWTAIPTVVSFVSFFAYVASGNELTAANAFTSIALFNLLRFPLNVLPNVISSCTQGWVSCMRLQRFFLRSEIKPPPEVPTTPMTSSDAPTVSAQNLTLRWPNGVSLLNDITFTCRPGSVTAIIGKTGTGKSGLLAALIGDLSPEPFTFDGKHPSTLTMQGRVAYVAQTAWIQNATLRDNILFGRPYNARWYSKVVRACALKDDLAILPSGDMTEIGEKGVNLSGGQKQRVSLARAAYQSGPFPSSQRPEDLPADIYVLDDCLSAVDSHVAQHIFARCIMGILRRNRRTIIMATHKVDILPYADHIVFLRKREAPPEGSGTRPPAATGGYAIAVGTFQSIRHLPEYTEFTREAETLEQQQEAAEVPSGSPGRRPTASPDTLARMTEAPPSATEPEPLLEPSPSLMSPAFRGGESPATLESLVPLRANSSYMEAHIAPSAPSAGRVRKMTDSTVESGVTRLSKQESLIATAEVQRKLVEEETAEKGAVSAAVYWSYFRGVGGAPVLLSIIIGLGLSQASSVGSNFWLSYWSDHSSTVQGMPTGIGVYTGLGLLQIAIFSCTSFFVILASQRASRYFHKQLLTRILRAPMSFFDSTPVGRLINRFSKDLYTIDQVLPMTMNTYMVNVFTVIATFTVIIVALPAFIAVAIPLLIVYVTVQNYYIPCTRQLQRMDSILRSPLFAHLSETLDGVTTIRAYRAQQRFRALNSTKLDSQQRAYYLLVSANRWLAVRLESVGTLVVLFAGLLAVFGGLTNTLSAGLGGLAVSYALNVTQSLNWMVRMASDRESNIVSVERVDNYSTTTPVEAPLCIAATQPPSDWPAEGRLAFNGYFLRYRPDLPYVLDDLNFEIHPEEKVGVVGRTGAGKSSLLIGLLRLVEPAGGRLVLDDVDLGKIGLYDLRSKLSIIPQDPVLFTGSLRFNLDPFERHDDAEIWIALERAHLKDFVLSDFEGGLLGLVEEGGRNVSVGQRQLVCLARALLRKSKVLLLDEATSAVDPYTDHLIQQTIREEFRHCTVLTVAHRLGTILDYDRVLVLDYGRVAEFGPPDKLMKKDGGLFRGLCVDAGIPVGQPDKS